LLLFLGLVKILITKIIITIIIIRTITKIIKNNQILKDSSSSSEGGIEQIVLSKVDKQTLEILEQPLIHLSPHFLSSIHKG